MTAIHDSSGTADCLRGTRSAGGMFYDDPWEDPWEDGVTLNAGTTSQTIVITCTSGDNASTRAAPETEKPLVAPEPLRLEAPPHGRPRDPTPLHRLPRLASARFRAREGGIGVRNWHR